MLELRAKDEQITQLEADVGVLRHQLADAQACAKAAGERNAGLEHQVEELQRQVERKSKALQDLVAFKESTKGLFAAVCFYLFVLTRCACADSCFVAPSCGGARLMTTYRCVGFSFALCCCVSLFLGCLVVRLLNRHLLRLFFEPRSLKLRDK